MYAAQPILTLVYTGQAQAASPTLPERINTEQRDSFEAAPLKEIRTLFSKMKDTKNIKTALDCVDGIMRVERSLGDYSYYQLAQIKTGSTSLAISLKPVSSDSKSIKYRDVRSLPKRTKDLLSETGMYGYVDACIQNIFFTTLPEHFEAIFSKKDQVAAMDIVTKSIIIARDPDRMSPLELAATLVHESHHMRNFRNYTTLKSMEEDAHKYELVFWKKLLEDTKEFTAEEVSEINMNINSLEERIRTGDY